MIHSKTPKSEVILTALGLDAQSMIVV